MATIEIDNMITVGDLAEKLMIPVTKLIGELMKNGIMVTVNERIDFETAQIITEELKLEDIELIKKEQEESLKQRDRKSHSNQAESRPPVVAVMGHVDHGKTSLLDAIRNASHADKEAGGITQHISAYQTDHNNRTITFLDTPGHEAFAALREHGAHLTDLAVIVIAADDGIKPQTQEAIRFASKAGVKTVFALTKVDKPEANQDRVKQQLAEQNLTPEDWGGDTIILPVSSKTKSGIPELLDMILLVADVEDLKADIDKPATGLVIESHMEKGRGPIAIALIEAGTLKQNSFVVAGTTYGRVRNLESTEGEKLEEAGPSTPVVISGLRQLPDFGEEFEVVESEKQARRIIEDRARGKQDTLKSSVSSGSQLLRMMNRSTDVTEFKVIVKADVKGSLTSVIDSLKTLENDEVSVRIVSSGVGNITDSDLQLANTSDAVIYGFNVEFAKGLKQVAVRDSISVRLYRVIYELIDDVKEELTNRLSPEISETDMGRLLVKGIFKTTKSEVICGGEVTKGKLVAPSLARVIRDGKQVADVEVTGLKHGPTDTKEVLEGEMCGMQLATQSKVELQEGDRIEVYTRQEVARKL
ncbi:translation initiation factor IF-2 [Candidatus Saccharibacteria bacterium]|nr:translation initiation factor IF-2 [Candidatus Saccharibacteria bacterium]